MNVEKNKVVFLHTPKTGGGAMEHLFYKQTKEIRRNYFFNFNGMDDSLYYNDDRATQHPNGNKCLIEGIHNNEPVLKRYNESQHFKECKFLMGHTTYSFGELFPQYNFEYITVLREPIIRTLSNILQFTSIMKDGKLKFGKYIIESEKGSKDYWNKILEHLKNIKEMKGLMIHEKHFLQNCQTRIMQGALYDSLDEKENLEVAIENAEKIHYSFFYEFNEGLQKSFDKLNIPIDMTLNHNVNNQNNKKNKLGDYYNATENVIDWVINNNKSDIELYDILLKKYKLNN